MKIKNPLFVIVLFFSLGNIYAQQNSESNFHNMLQQLLSHTVAEVHPDQVSENCIFLDAREPAEYTVSHIPGAIEVGYDGFNVKKWQYLDKNTPIVVYCTVGYRSEKVAEKLLKKGFTDVKNLYGGIFAWTHHNKPIVTKKEGSNRATDSIHTYNKEWSAWLRKGVKVY